MKLALIIYICYTFIEFGIMFSNKAYVKSARRADSTFIHVRARRSILDTTLTIIVFPVKQKTRYAHRCFFENHPHPQNAHKHTQRKKERKTVDGLMTGSK